MPISPETRLITTGETLRLLDDIYDAAQTDSMAAVYASIRAARRSLTERARGDDINSADAMKQTPILQWWIDAVPFKTKRTK